ncbi:DUF4113 domain-containing protein [Limnobacter sp.]
MWQVPSSAMLYRPQSAARDGSEGSGFDRKWSMKCSNRSPDYTTRWSEMPCMF